VSGYEFETIAPTIIEVDRARDVSNVSSFDLPTNYESSLVLANVRGTLDITSFPSLDIHSVPFTDISLSTTETYNSTKIGTIYANMIRYNDAYNSDIGNTHTFTVNTFGANTVPITGTLAAAGSSATTIAIPTAFNAGLPLNAYANMYFQITNGSGASLSPILITSSNTVTLNLASSLTFIPGSNTFTIQSDIKNAESLTISDGTYIQFAGNVDTDSKDPTTGFVSISVSLLTQIITGIIIHPPSKSRIFKKFYLETLYRSMVNRYADYKKENDQVRADAISMLIKKFEDKFPNK
jgi:hypothetical protein